MIMLISAPFVSANSAIAEKTLVFMASGPSWTTSSSGPSDAESVSTGTAMPAISVTRMYTASAIPRPRNSAGGKTRLGLRVSSATFTESSNPISAKKASDAPERIASGTASPDLNSSARPGSPPPSSRNASPIAVTSSRPVSSIAVSPRLSAHRLLDAAEVEQRERADEHGRDDHLRHRHELGQVVAAERRGERRGGRDPRAHDREGDQEREERALVGLVRVERRAGRLRVLRHQLGVRRRRERGEDARGEERRPHRAADLAGDLADERVDARAEDVADHEHRQHRARDGRPQRRLGAPARLVRRRGCAHGPRLPGLAPGHDPADPGRRTSLWMDTAPHTTYPAARPQSSIVDVCVVGGGILGPAVRRPAPARGRDASPSSRPPASRPASPATRPRRSPSLHGLIYDQVRSHFGADGARAYAAGQHRRPRADRRLRRRAGIDCDFRRRPAFTYAEDDDDVDSVRKEVDAAPRARACPPSSSTDVDLPVGRRRRDPPRRPGRVPPAPLPARGRREIHGGGSHVFERTRVTGVDDGDPCRVEHRRRAPEVTARRRSSSPRTSRSLDRGLFFARLSPERSYALGVRARGALAARACSCRPSRPRTPSAPTPHDGGELLIVGGESHKAGHGRPGRALRARSRPGRASASTSRRSSTAGRPRTRCRSTGSRTSASSRPVSRHVWTATGFKKWGITNGAAAAMMLADAIGGPREPVGGDVRREPLQAARRGAASLLKEGAERRRALLRRPARVARTSRSLDELAPGEGGIVKVDGRQASPPSATTTASCTPSRRSARTCTARSRFNAAERSWDCPCHGSRFAPDGTVLEGPAVNPLERRQC